MSSPGKSEGMDSDLFDDLVQGLEAAVAHRAGKPVEGTCEHRFERLPDGSVRRVGPVIEY